MGKRLYVYYRVRASDEALVCNAVHDMHARWAPELRCELLRRTDDRSDGVTLMETYAAEDGISDDWQARIEAESREALTPWLIGQRHIERFEPCA